MFHRILCAFVFAAMAVADAARPDPVSAAGRDLMELSGKRANPFGATRDEVLVFLFLRTDCPIANSYAPEIKRIWRDFRGKGAGFFAVYSDSDETPGIIRRHLREYDFPMGALRDPKRTFAARSKVTVTPEAAIYRRDGSLLYHGRIDDRFADFGKARPLATTHDLSRAMAQALAGERVAPAGGSAVGCDIEGVK
jgi:hypothetical protein